MIVNSARFVISNSKPQDCPKEMRHEFAFIGRSNVGKSSLINMLTGQKGLAMTSSTPGKTMLINHFLINDEWYLVDLPGYGYAQRSKTDRENLSRMIKSYIAGREQMTNLFLLVDGRHQPQKIDLEFMNWLGENGVPFSIVFTKLDKLSSTAAKTSTALYCEKLLEEWEELPPIFKSSAVDKRGRSEILDYIEQLCKLPVGCAVIESGDSECSGEAHQVNYDGDGSVKMEKISNDNSTMKEKEEKKVTAEEKKARRDYPGAAIDAADKDKADWTLEKERTATLNHNSQTTDF